jgi:hypothetical protein
VQEVTNQNNKIMTNKIRQSDFMRDHNIPVNAIRAIRDEQLQPGEWWKEGATIYWTEEAAQRVAASLEQPTPQTDEQDQEGQPGFQEQPEAPLPLPEVPTGADACADTESVGSDPQPPAPAEEEAQAPVKAATLTVRVLKRARNYRFVYASLDGERVSVLCPKKGRKNIVGKNVQVSRQIVAGEPQYTLIP